MVSAHGIPGWFVRVVEETGSTNADLLQAAARGAVHRSVLVARHQHAGRGRLGRTWDAPPGANLLVSVLFRVVPEHPVELTHRVGLAACLVAIDLTGADVSLKWPNDLLVGDDKLAGILAQSGAAPDGRPFVVVGLGLNVGWCPVGGARLGDGFDPLDVLRAVLTRYDALPGDVRGLYRQHLGTLGRQVRAIMPSGDVHGTAVDVDETGRLMIRRFDGTHVAVDTADITHLREKPDR